MFSLVHFFFCNLFLKRQCYGDIDKIRSCLSLNLGLEMFREEVVDWLPEEVHVVDYVMII
jgi:hypothetical protein